MTTDTQLTPTDAELWQLHMQMPGRHKDPIDFARAVLARWGQPAHSGEPAAWEHDCAALLTNDVELWIDACPHCGKPRNAPQPEEREPQHGLRGHIRTGSSKAAQERHPMTNTTNTSAASGADDNCTILPDGSAFAVGSFPLPQDHWLYAPHEYEPGADEPKELLAPILTHAQRNEVVAAVRYAVRGATMCGKEPDFDPDALVQNAVYALCGPFGRTALAAPATQQPEGDVVAYLDVGANGYLDLGSELSEDALQQLPKGRHALVIAGTYGIDGYVAAPQPSTTAQADSVQEDAARYRWLREGNDAKHGAAWHVAVNLYGCEWDAAIDAAMNKGANHDR